MYWNIGLRWALWIHVADADGSGDMVLIRMSVEDMQTRRETADKNISRDVSIDAGKIKT